MLNRELIFSYLKGEEYYGLRRFGKEVIEYKSLALPSKE